MSVSKAELEHLLSSSAEQGEPVVLSPEVASILATIVGRSDQATISAAAIEVADSELTPAQQAFVQQQVERFANLTTDNPFTKHWHQKHATAIRQVLTALIKHPNYALSTTEVLAVVENSGIMDKATVDPEVQKEYDNPDNWVAFNSYQGQTDVAFHGDYRVKEAVDRYAYYSSADVTRLIWSLTSGDPCVLDSKLNVVLNVALPT